MPNWRTLYWMIEWPADTLAYSSIWQNKKHIITRFWSICIPCNFSANESCVSGYPAIETGTRMLLSNQGAPPLQLAGCRRSVCKETRTRKGWTCLNLWRPTPKSPSNIPFFAGCLTVSQGQSNFMQSKSTQPIRKARLVVETSTITMIFSISFQD